MTTPPPPQKQRYRYKFRTLTDPAEHYSLEAGPFTPQQAAGYGSNEANNRTAVTGKAWVWDYEPIVDTEGRLPLPWPRLVLFALSVAFLLLGLFAFQYAHQCWWVWTVASILCGWGVLRPFKDDDNER